MATNDVIVQVVFNSDGIERITADFVDLDLFSVRNKPIDKWFEASGGRASWEGLIEEIQRAVQDHEARILFYYENGIEDLVSRFNACLEKEHNVNVYVAQSDEAKARFFSTMQSTTKTTNSMTGRLLNSRKPLRFGN